MKGEKRIFKTIMSVLLAVAVCIAAFPFSEKRVCAEGIREYTIMSRDVTGETDVFAYYPSSKWRTGQINEYFTSEPVDTQIANGAAASDIYYTVKFVGIGAVLYGYKAPAHGASVKVFVDDEEKGSFDSYAAQRTSEDVELWRVDGLEDKEHILKVVATGGRNNAVTNAANTHIEVTKAVITVPVGTATGIVLDQDSYNIRKGESVKLTYQFQPEGAQRPDDLVFVSGDTSVAEIDEQAVITAKGVGETEITVSSESGKFSKSVRLTVLEQKDDLDAMFVDSGDQYQQKAYERLRTGEKERSRQEWAWKNDRAVSEIAVLSKGKNLENVSVSVTDLQSVSASIPASQVELSFVREVKAYTGHAGWYAQNKAMRPPTGDREYFPEVIYSGDPVDVDSERIQLVWVETSVPENTPAGVYKGKITISAENTEETVELDYAVEVQNAVLPDPQDYLFDVEYWSHPYNVAYYYEVEPFSDEHLELLRQHMELYKSLGGHAITASIVEEAWDGQTYGGGNDIHYPSMIKWIKNTDGSWRFDYTHFDKWVELNLEIGIADKIICYSMMPWDNVVKYTDEASGTMMQMRAQPGNAVQYAEVWQPFMEDFVRHLDEKGWFDRTYIGFDERTGMATALNLIDSVQNKDGNVLKKSAAFNDFQSNKAVFDRLDSASVGLQQIRDHLEGFKQQIIERRDNGKELTLYTATEHVPNSFTKSNPVESYWTIMYAGSLNTTGFLRWAYDAWVEAPLEESTHWSFPAGDCFLVYPSEKDAEVKESKFSIRLAKLNEGVRDINKLYMMREEYPELAAKADKILENVSGDEIGDYEYSTMAPTDSWGRQAKWLTEKGKKDMLSDMAAVKQGLYEFTKEYTTKKYPGTIQEIEILGADEKEFECGETLQLSMRVEPSTAAQSEVSWSSSNPSVASVDGKGLVTMKSAGEAVITAASAENANIMQSIKVRVVSSEAKEELNRQTDAIAKLPKDKYTADTWKKVEVALAEANAVLKKTDATPQEIKIALDNLKKAVDGLKLAEAKPPIDIPVKPTPALEKGKEYSVGALKYVILSTSPAKAALSGSKSKSLKTLKMTPEVTVNGVKCKVTGIQAKAFRNCRNLKSAVIGANVTTIGKQAFYGCKKLSKINFKGKKAPKLGKQAFKGTAKKVKVLAVKMKKKQRQAFMKKLKKAGMRTIK